MKIALTFLILTYKNVVVTTNIHVQYETNVNT